ncbi:hypothetical protein A4H97_31220 [Niastella yeongjuensis]|uniref:Uncharacterized protein n=1 Tax=Niastella yeongjuensis TaxID=354355 RepID=A0A1V9EK54_9BACT|nr:hypothetical protein [Niastella yeongjuensis]OQP46235.1 hypothetical protein A4H97_31220 [Niastella yeongjuensis]SEP46044.1 hypothetical protein SAMN05660816_06400 [Niastella yeongjuensis]
MQENNLIRSLQYLEDTGRNLLTEVRGRSRNLGDHDGEFDSWWKFYQDLTPHLVGYAAEQKNEYINELVNKYQQHFTYLDHTLTPVDHTSFLKLLAKVFGSRNSLSRQEQALILEDISNNVGNLLYQVKINAA